MSFADIILPVRYFYACNYKARRMKFLSRKSRHILYWKSFGWEESKRERGNWSSDQLGMSSSSGRKWDLDVLPSVILQPLYAQARPQLATVTTLKSSELHKWW
jgi:hypothetical protein